MNKKDKRIRGSVCRLMINNATCSRSPAIGESMDAIAHETDVDQQLVVVPYWNKGDNYRVSPCDCDELCGDCICSSCTVWGYIFCFNKMSRYKRTEILWAWILFSSLTIGLCIGVGMFGVNAFKAAPTDMRIINERYSPIFCDQLVLRAEDTFDAYRFIGNLPTNETRREKFQKEYTEYVDHNDYFYYSYYLLQWSTITVISCSDDDMELYVIQGQNNFNIWKEKTFCIACYLNKIPVKTNGCFLSYNKYSLTVSETDHYYFVFNNKHKSTWLTVKIKINRYLYDTSETTQMCSGDVKCDIPLDFANNELVVYYINSNTPYSSITMTSTCKARIWMYVAIFVVCPGCTGLLVTIIIYITCTDPKADGTSSYYRSHGRSKITRYRSETTSDERSHMLCNSQDPPTYEDIVTTTSGTPSYGDIKTSTPT